MVPIWDLLVRALHWTLATSIAVAWFTRTGSPLLHEIAGYLALTCVVIRVAWGFVGREHALFRSFLKSPGQTMTYARAVLRGREARHLGHNPLGAWMIVALLGTVMVVSLTGWLYTTDRFWGVEWVANLHDALADALLLLVALHVVGVVVTSWRHRENLVAAMFHGRKRRE
jgi:cytochrome b